ncbi:MAG: membrane protein insertion efficiency factor YidD [Trichocoleus desertorum ATA4-8-CV12]|jgi:putative component of membrane protein insertase Oxa1/YidC/SpoIIIJ protein YidD|nr:membrane protein insertion efficiency factor YidD [Trichocoleus desertorum ATA4-8-CV12]
METPIPDLWVRQVAASAIAGYQTHLSPHKGFSCAHRLLHGGDSCSQHVKRVILEQGSWAAILAMRSRFAECKVANQVLQARRTRHLLQAQSRRSRDAEKPGDRGSHSQNSCSEVDGLISCLDCAEPCSVMDCSSMDCTSMDCSLGEQSNCADFDCGSGLDYSGCDCSGADCGSCG